MNPFVQLSPPYSTIVADPPWRYRQQRVLTASKSERTKPDVAKRYSTMTAAEVADLPVADLAATDAHLYLWTTNPKLPEAFDVIEAWGFEYVTLITWHKRPGTLGLGFYWRGQTEHLVFGIRGHLPIPPERRERNIIEAAATGHSRKPPAVMDAIERVSPGPYLELFAREPRLGWDSWGHGYESSAAGSAIRDVCHRDPLDICPRCTAAGQAGYRTAITQGVNQCP